MRYQRQISEVDVKTKAEKMYRVFDDMALDKFLLNIWRIWFHIFLMIFREQA